MYDDDDDKKIDQDDAAEPVIPDEAIQPEKGEDTPDDQEEEMQQPESPDSDESSGTSQEEAREDSQEEENAADGTSSPDTLEHLDALLTQFNESLIRFNEALDRFDELSEKITADLPQIVDASAKLEQHLQAVEDAVQEEKTAPVRYPAVHALAGEHEQTLYRNHDRHAESNLYPLSGPGQEI